MADRTPGARTLRNDPLGHLLGGLHGVGSPQTVVLRPLPFLTHLELWVDPASPAAPRVASVLGHALPAPGDAAPVGTARTVLAGDEWGGDEWGGDDADAGLDDPASVLGLGPDWFLLVGAPGTAGAWEAALSDALGDDGCAVDVSAGRTALELSGPRALDVLAHGCSLDLHPRVFGSGRCARTRLAQTRVVLHRPLLPPGQQVPAQRRPGQRRTATDDVPQFRVHVDTSYADHLVRWLQDAMTEYVPTTPYAPSGAALVAPSGEVTP